MDFKKLFVKVDETAEKPSQPTPAAPTSNQGVKFPSSPEPVVQNFNTASVQTPSFTFTPTTPSNTGGVPQEYIDKALSIYQQGFDSMNQPGFDFYEYFQLILNGGPENPPVYAMAFSMSNGMDKSLTKEKLIQGAEHYQSEITNQFNGYVAQGNSKKESIEAEKSHENQALSSEVETLSQQIESLKFQLEDRQRKLREIDSKYEPQLKEIDAKQQANVIAKDKVINSIEQVKQGIINNLK